MALTGERYVGMYEGHTLELIRNNWLKSLSLWIDGKQVATKMSIWPWSTTLSGSLEYAGVAYSVVARSIPYRILWTKDSIEVNGQVVALTKTY